MASIFDKNRYVMARAALFVGMPDGSLRDVGEVTGVVITPTVTTLETKGGTSGAVVDSRVTGTAMTVAGTLQSASIDNQALAQLTSIVNVEAKTATKTFNGLKAGRAYMLAPNLDEVTVGDLVAGTDYSIKAEAGYFVPTKDSAGSVEVTYTTKAATAIGYLSKNPEGVPILLDGTASGEGVIYLNKVVFGPASQLSMNADNELLTLAISGNALEDPDAEADPALGKYGYKSFPEVQS